MPALDYTRLAAVYDDYCDFDRDLDFFRSLLVRRRGRVLELMAGTGRLSVPLLEAEIELTCLDSSAAMLRVLQRKLGERSLSAALVCADVRALPLRARFDTVILPFHGFCELVTGEEQRQAMDAVAGVLAERGRFVCTTHNPAMRRRTLDGTWHEMGEFPRRAGGVVRLALKGRLDPPSGIVKGQQRLEVVDEAGGTSEVLIPLRFSLVSASDLSALAEVAGLAPVSLCGDYDGSCYDETTSPVVIATFERTA
jgi:SAM-dependent methyltransferase